MIPFPGIAAWAALILLALSGSPLSAQVHKESYAILSRQLDGRIGFETLPRRPEPGIELNAPMRFRGAWLGERLSGQSVDGQSVSGKSVGGAPHDVIRDAPDLPLVIVPGQAGQNLSVALHRGFGSNALLALGPAGFDALGGRGEGALAILFDRDQAAFGLRIHADYIDPLGSRPAPGSLQMMFYSRAGRLIGQTEHQLRPGITEIGLRRDGNIPDIAAIIITNTDPGGIAIDDIVFQFTAMTG